MKSPKVMESYGNVDVINICDLLECLFPGYFDSDAWMKIGFDEEGEAVIKWIADNDAYYYGKPKEDFFIGEAVRECAELGKYLVVVEDMS